MKNKSVSPGIKASTTIKKNAVKKSTIKKSTPQKKVASKKPTTKKSVSTKRSAPAKKTNSIKKSVQKAPSQARVSTKKAGPKSKAIASTPAKTTQRPQKKSAISSLTQKKNTLKLTKKYSPAAQKEVEKELHKFKEGTVTSGSGKTPVESREQAIAIGLSKARKNGAKVPAKK